VDLHIVLKAANDAHKKGFLEKDKFDKPEDHKAFELAWFI
jgi:hypothetical protein